jgi:hypothetical protein
LITKLLHKGKYGVWRDNATSKDYRKYFNVRERAQVGISGNSKIGYDFRQFDKFELTSCPGHRNTFKEIQDDFKVLIKRLKRGCADTGTFKTRKGKEVSLLRNKFVGAYFAVAELSPVNQLVHLHGLIRNDDWFLDDPAVGNYEKPFNQAQLSYLWEDIHGAYIVWIEKPVSMQDVIDYMVKDVIKEYPDTSNKGFRVMVSDNWLPENYKIVRTILHKNTHIKCLFDEDADKSIEYALMYETYLSWARGEMIQTFSLNNRKEYGIRGQKVYDKNRFLSLIEHGQNLRIVKIN